MKPIHWKGDHAELIDQTLLPHRQVWVACRRLAEFADAIFSMKIRGAPAIGITAAYGLAAQALASKATSAGALLAELREAGETLSATRPTAVNLRWAVERMLRSVAGGASVEAIRTTAVAEAVAIATEDEAMCRAIGQHGAGLVPSGQARRILTHCNAGALATGDYGTALGVVRAAHERGLVGHVWVDETRPFLQGARLTAWELMEDGVPVRLICDNMAGHFMQRGEVDLVVVGADRIAANGDVANKIGTYSLAVLCRHHGIPFYVAAPTSTIDLATPSGKEIPIEERSGDEVRRHGGNAVAPSEVPVANPAFDMTPGELVTAIVTERGVVRAPYREGLAALLTPVLSA